MKNLFIQLQFFYLQLRLLLSAWLDKNISWDWRTDGTKVRNAFIIGCSAVISIELKLWTKDAQGHFLHFDPFPWGLHWDVLLAGGLGSVGRAIKALFEQHAIPVSSVPEVVRVQNLNPEPLTPKAIVAISNDVQAAAKSSKEADYPPPGK